MKGRLSMTKFRSGGAFLTDDQYQCLPMAPRELPIDPWRCPGRLQGIVLCFP